MAHSKPAPTPPEHLPASIGRYTLQELVGRGAAGVVYRATLNGPAGFRKRLAIKLIAGGSSSEVVSEARLGALLDHPNVVEIYDLTYASPWWLIAMEWVRGPTLLEVLQARGAMPGRALQQVGAQLASALSHAHALEVDGQMHTVVHRDLKPSNVLLTRTAMVKLADLGLAALAGSSHESAVGTPGYMAPEQLAVGGQVDPRTDQFALGILLAEMALGRRMVRGKTVEDVQARHERLADEIDRGLLQRSIDLVTPGLGDVVAQCLSLAADHRFENCTALGHALAALPAGGASLEEWMTEAQLSPVLSSDRTSTVPGSSATTGAMPLFGRSADQAALAETIERFAVVTVQGPGGVGKSALVRRLAAAAERKYAGGAFVCDVAPVRDVNGLCASVANALGLPLGPGTEATVISQVGHQLRVRGPLLLFLDDADAITALLGDVLPVWQAIATEARFVVTSRTRLNLPEEAVVRIEPLSVDDAVTLLRDRAVRAGGAETWQPAGQEATLRALVEQLEGLPLALELAAARAPQLSPADLLTRLTDRTVLMRSAPGQPSALETALRDSWEQLSPGAQRGLAQLSVFRGGFTLEDAERIVERQPDDPWVTDLVRSLIDRSLVVARRRPSGQPRFRLYETIRQYAAQRLENPAPVALRHARWFARWGGPAYIVSPPDDPMRERQSEDLDNYLAGIETALRAGESTTAASCAVAACRVIANRGPMARGIEVVERVLPVAPDHAALLEVAARLGQQTEDPRVRDWAERAVMSAVDLRERVAARLALGGVLRAAARRDEATATYEAAQIDAHHLGDPVTEGRVALALGTLLMHGQDTRGQLGYALRVGRLTKHRELTILALLRLAEHSSLIDDLPGARRRLEQVLEQCRDMPLHEAEAHRLWGLVDHRMGRTDEARQHMARALQLFRNLGLRRREAGTLSNIATVDLIENRFDEAREQLEAGLALGLELEMPELIGNLALNLGIVQFRIGSMDEAVAAIMRARENLDGLDRAVQQGVADNHLVLIDVERDALEAAIERGRESLTRLRQLGDVVKAIRIGALSALANALALNGELAESRALAEEALAEDPSMPVYRGVAKLEVGYAAALAGDPRAHEILVEALTDAEQSTDVWVQGLVILRQTELALYLGEVDRAATLIEPLIERGLGPLRGFQAHADGLGAVVALRRRVAGATRKPVDEAIERLDGFGMHGRARRLRMAVAKG